MREVYLDELDDKKIEELVNFLLNDCLESFDVNLVLWRAGGYDLYGAIEQAIYREFHKARRHRIEDDEYWTAKRRDAK